MGGAGQLQLGNINIRLESLHLIGLSSEDVQRLSYLTLPPGGLLVIENLTPFQACLEHFGCNGSVLFLWSGGFPNRGIKKLLEEVASRKVPIRVWCDLDLGGIRIARLIHEITGGLATPVLMDPATLHGATTSGALSSENVIRIRRDLEQHPGALLSDTLRAILDKKAWVEQEVLLHNSGKLFEYLAESFARTTAARMNC